ncbi:MAG: GntR family transcriptional regulator [Candidatus Omnitrophica bacterium]|nr:GntR family transcriptional regulator [Candidatus Omnitrophota bacterium]
MAQFKKPQGSRIVRNADTIDEPKALAGMFDVFRVISIVASGLFMDWGFPEDLFVPKGEQRKVMELEKSYVVYIAIDEKTQRIAASAKVDNFLNVCPLDVKKDDAVDLLICEKTDLGYNVIINNAFRGLLFNDGIFKPLAFGQRVPGFIKNIREDGKIDVCLQKTGYKQVPDLAGMILDHLKAVGGKSKLTDKTPADEIYKLFGVSKKKFKMAVGLLYKKKFLAVEDDGLRWLPPASAEIKVAAPVKPRTFERMSIGKKVEAAYVKDGGRKAC